jgi:phi13 family phage major tail protein
MSNKIKYGLKNVHYAVVSDVGGIITYGAPVAIPGAVNLTLSPRGETYEFYADDALYYGQESNNGYEGSMEIALIPDSFKTAVLGYITDTNGALIEDSAAVAKNFALMFEFKGDKKSTRHVLYNVRPQRPNIEGSTVGANIEAKTDTLNITANPASDTGYVKAKMEQGQVGYDTFYSAVYLFNAVTNTVGAETDAFSKVAAADIVIDVTSSSLTTKVVNVKNNGSLVPGIKLTVSDPDVTIDKSYFSGLANGVYDITVEFDKGNSVSVAVTVGD